MSVVQTWRMCGEPALTTYRITTTRRCLNAYPQIKPPALPLETDFVDNALVPERDVAALADRLSALPDHPERWEAMGRAGRARVEAEGVKLKGVGIAERPERLLVLLVSTLLVPLNEGFLAWGVGLMAVLSSITVAERVYKAGRFVSSEMGRSV